jgi:hypothetical protein
MVDQLPNSLTCHKVNDTFSKYDMGAHNQLPSAIQLVPNITLGLWLII